MHNKVSKTIQFARLQCWYYWWGWFMRYTDIHTKFHVDWFWNSGNVNVTTSTVLEVVVLVLLMTGISWVRCWYGLMWHDIRTKSHDYRFKHWSNISSITSTIWEDIVLVLLMRRIYDVRHWDGCRWHMYIPSFMTIDTGIQAILRYLRSERPQCWYYWWEGFMMYANEMAADGMICTCQVLWRLIQGIKAILRYLRSERPQCWHYWWEGFMNYAVEMGSGALIYIPSRVSESKTRVWIGESVYWIFTTRNYN
jgi:hypothetical protein